MKLLDLRDWINLRLDQIKEDTKKGFQTLARATGQYLKTRKV
jgi:hypothetical protein